MIRIAVLSACLSAAAARAQDFPGIGLHPGYRLVTIRPPDFKPQVCALELLPVGKLLVVTWRGMLAQNGKVGDAYILSGVDGPDASAYQS